MKIHLSLINAGPICTLELENQKHVFIQWSNGKFALNLDSPGSKETCPKCPE